MPSDNQDTIDKNRLPLRGKKVGYDSAEDSKSAVILFLYNMFLVAYNMFLDPYNRFYFETYNMILLCVKCTVKSTVVLLK